MSVLKVGIPKGSLEKATIELFEKSGWKIRMMSRNYFPEIDDPELSVSICRPQEMYSSLAFARGYLQNTLWFRTSIYCIAYL